MGTGKVSKHDLRRILFNELQVFPSHMDELMKTVDTDGRGEVVFGEWLSNYNRGLPSSRSRAAAPVEPVSSLRSRIDAGLGLRSITHTTSLEKDHLPRFTCLRFWTSSRAGVQRHRSMSHR